MISISTIFFGCRGKSLIESVQKAAELGFEGVELRQEHIGKGNVWETIKKIKSDFRNIAFTIHAPLWNNRQITILNPAMGLTQKNLKSLDKVFKGAEIVEAENIVFHAGFREMVFFNRVAWLPRVHWPKLKMPNAMAKKGLMQFMKKAAELATEIDTNVLIENPPHSKLDLVIETKQDFEQLFNEIPEIGLALDMSHCFARKSLDEFVELENKIKEVHVAYSNTSEDLHLPVSMEHLENLKKIPNVKKLPLVLEHNARASLDELISEKKMVEKFLKNI